MKVKLTSAKHGKTHYDSIAEFWKDAQQNAINIEGERKLREGAVIRLIDFNLTEWYPWAPGLYWTPFGMNLRYRSFHYMERNTHVMDRINQVIFHDNKRRPMLSPHGKTLTVLSGIGAVRTKLRKINNEDVKIIGATSPEHNFADENPKWSNVSAGVPILMHKKAYDKIREKVEKGGVVKATLEGFYTEIPEVLENLFWRAPDIPRYCIYVGSQSNVTDIHEGGNTFTAGWSIFEDKRHEYKMSFCTFATQDENGAKDAGRFIEEYIHGHEGIPITDFDEKIPRLNATYPISNVADATLDKTKLRALAQKIRKKYPV